MRNFVVLLLIGLALLTLALVVRSGMFARKNPGEPINSTMRLALENQGMPELSMDDATIIRREFPEARRLTSGLMYVLRQAGNGPAAQPGREVAVHYEGRLIDGTVFDSSLKRGTPFTFRAGRGEVILGWDEAILQMRQGDKRTLIVPHWLGYGVNGRPPRIPPRATLIFEVELVEVR